MQLGAHAVVVATFQDVRHFTAATRVRYEQLGARTSLTAAVGSGMADPPARGVRGAHFSSDDELAGEWDIVVLGSRCAGALVARGLGDPGPDQERRFEFVLTFDRAWFIDASPP